jgi:hypothetical protein
MIFLNEVLGLLSQSRGCLSEFDKLVKKDAEPLHDVVLARTAIVCIDLDQQRARPLRQYRCNPLVNNPKFGSRTFDLTDEEAPALSES